MGRKAWLGVKFEAAEGGLRVADLAPFGPAAALGLEKGALLLEINGKPVSEASAASAVLQELKPGAPLALTIGPRAKDGKGQKLPAAFALPRPADEALSAGWQ